MMVAKPFFIVSRFAVVSPEFTSDEHPGSRLVSVVAPQGCGKSQAKSQIVTDGISGAGVYSTGVSKQAAGRMA
jgi:hypothetical protein